MKRRKNYYNSYLVGAWTLSVSLTLCMKCITDINYQYLRSCSARAQSIRSRKVSVSQKQVKVENV